MSALYPNPLWQSNTITASSSATEYSIYQSPVGDYSLFVSLIITENKVLADEIHIRITFDDNSQFTDVFSNLSIGNYGTAMFRSFWKLKFYTQVKYVGSTQIVEEAVTIQQLNSGNDFLLTSVPKPFEPGVPNFYDTKQISGVYNISTSSNQIVDIFNLLVEIADEEGIAKNLLFCNSEKSLPREEVEGDLTGRFYLFKYTRP